MNKNRRTDHGKKHTGWRLEGSMRAVQKSQHVAVDSLVKVAAKDRESEEASNTRRTWLGFKRTSLVASVADLEPPVADKKLQDFRKNTEDRKKLKSSSEVWVGHASQPPKMRRARKAPAQANMVASAARWLARRPRALAAPQGMASSNKSSSSSSNAAPATCYDSVVWSHVQGRQTMVVDALDDLVKKNSFD